MNSKSYDEHLIEAIPDPQAVREQLAQSLRNAKLLRHLLKLSERVLKERVARQGVSDDR